MQPPREMVWWLQVMMVVVAEGHGGERKKRKG